MEKLFFAFLYTILLCSCGANADNISYTEPVNTQETQIEDTLKNEQERELTLTEGHTEAAYQKITPDEAQTMMNSAESFVLLDVRTEEEYKEKRISGAVLIPDYEIAVRAKTELPDKSELIFVYCRSGRRSASAAKELVDMGYINIYDFGGIIDWPYETISD